MRRVLGERTPELVIGGLVALLVVVALVAGGSSSEGDAAAEAESVRVEDLPVARISKQVEEIRRLRFKQRPRPKSITAEATRQEALDELDRDLPESRRLADEEVMKLLGLLKPDDDVRAIAGTIYGGEVAGFYNPRKGELAVVTDLGSPDKESLELTLAHELNHALEDQRFDIDSEGDKVTDDAALAESALVEGTATAVMLEYGDRHMDLDYGLAAALLGSLQAAGTDLPPYIEAQLLFPYAKGERFVRELYRATGDWKLVNLALRRHRPSSTEQILHPEKYLRFEEPDPIRLRVGSVLGSGWRQVADLGFGEFDTDQLLRLGVSDDRAEEAATGWGGGRAELWRQGPLPAEGCAAPCRERDVLVVAWRWDSPRDAAKFVPPLTAALQRGVGARPTGPGTWSIGSGAARLAIAPEATVLVMAPDPALAAEVADRTIVDLGREPRTGSGSR